METWKDIKRYEGLYQVSDCGRIKSLDRYVGYKTTGKRLIKGAIKVGTITSKGYVKITLFKDGKGTTREIQRIVAETFIDNPCNKEQVNHIDENKLNNNIGNLEWSSPRENTIHAKTVLKKGIKRVNQYDMQGHFIKSYPSIKKASECTNIPRCSISNVVCGRRNKAGNYKWKLEEVVSG